MARAESPDTCRRRARSALAIVVMVLAGAWLAEPLAGRDATVVGRIVIAHQDGVTPGASRMRRAARDSARARCSCSFRKGCPCLRARASRCAIRATSTAPIVEATSRGSALRRRRPANPNIGPANFTPGPRKVLVLLMQVRGQPAPGGADAIRNIIFTAPNSANAFVQQETFGQLSLTGKLRSDGDVYGPYTVTMAPNVCDPVGWGRAPRSSSRRRPASTPRPGTT